MDWHEIKVWLEQSSKLDMDALHVYAGVLLQLAIAMVFRRTLRSPIPWLVVLAAILANEYYDYRYEIWPDAERALQRAEGIKDVWNTMLLPTAILLLARFHPRLFARWPASAADPGEAGGQSRQ
jgi:hypothetical protein